MAKEIKFSNPEALEKNIEKYFKSLRVPKTERRDGVDCYVRDEDGEIVFDDDKARPPTMSGLALYLGTTRKTLLDYMSRAHSGQFSARNRKIAAECGEKLLMAKAKIEAYLEERLANGYTKGIEFTLTNGYEGWAARSAVAVEAQMEHKAEVKAETKGVLELTDAELMSQMELFRAKIDEIMKREGVERADG